MHEKVEALVGSEYLKGVSMPVEQNHEVDPLSLSAWSGEDLLRIIVVIGYSRDGCLPTMVKVSII